MLTTRTALNLILFVVLFLGLEQGAQACAMCTYAIFWRIFPPVVPWTVIMLVWYFCYSLVVTIDGGQLLYIRRLPGSLGWIGPAILLSVIILGPIIMFIFGAICLTNFAVSLWPFPLLGWSPWLRWQVRVVGVIFIVALGYTAVTEYATARKMDQADVIMKWDGTVPSIHAFQDLKEQEPASLPLYRKIIREGESFTRARAAMRLAEVGDPEEDVPLLIEALTDEYQLPENERYAADDINEALHMMTRIKLPPETPPEVWLEKWNAFHE